MKQLIREIVSGRLAQFLGALYVGSILLVSTLAYAKVNDTVHVRLPTETSLLPLYLAKPMPEDDAVAMEQVDIVDQLLRFDLSHNGSTQVVDLQVEPHFIAHTFADPTACADDWRSRSVLFVVLPAVSTTGLTVQVLHTTTGKVHGVHHLTLSNDKAANRRRMHSVADAIHMTLFGEAGIASTRLIFTRQQDNSKGEHCKAQVWESDYDGGNARQVTHGPGHCVSPTFLPAKAGKRSQQFLYVSYDLGQPKICHASLRTGKSQQLLKLHGNQLLPAVSRQRDALAFISDVTSNPDLFLASFNPDEGVVDKPKQLYTARGATQSGPAFSPDGRRIAFVSDKANSPKIYLLDLPAQGIQGNFKNLTTQLIHTKTRSGTAPSWSPDGTKIAFCSLTKGVRQLWYYDTLTGREHQITYGPSHKENPSWAPNSLHLVYNTADINSAELYMVNLRQLKPIQLQIGAGEKHYPSWEPM